jgi:hypothetical protein
MKRIAGLGQSPAKIIECKNLLQLSQVFTAAEGGSVSRAEALASAFADATREASEATGCSPCGSPSGRSSG